MLAPAAIPEKSRRTRAVDCRALITVVLAEPRICQERAALSLRDASDPTLIITPVEMEPERIYVILAWRSKPTRSRTRSIRCELRVVRVRQVQRGFPSLRQAARGRSGYGFVSRKVPVGGGKIDESIRILEAAFHRDGSGHMGMGELGLAYAWAGRREEAAKLALASASEPLTQARIFAGLGDFLRKRLDCRNSRR